MVLACRAAPVVENGPPPPPPGSIDTIPIAGHALYVPHGFTVNLFAEGVNGVRYLALDPNGAVYASLPGAGQIVRLVDANRDGVADGPAQPVLTGLDGPFGVAFRGDTMYFAEVTTVKRLDPGASAPVTLVSGLPSGGHSTRTVVFGPDNRLYVAVGSSCNVCDDPQPRAAVTRFNLDGSNPHTFATGLRNSVGLAFNPTTGELWANNNDRDDIGPTQAATDNLPPEHLNILKDGKWYGWPQCYLPGKANPEYSGFDCSSVEPPALTVQAHSAPLGLAFYAGTLFPADYRGDAFMTYHGSWNRSMPTGAKVVRVHVAGGRPTGSEDFVTGWQLADGTRWGRPVGLLVLPDGSLLVSDDAGNRIWRVGYGN
jgi:glucose/arabinose dehydrogenase